MNANKKLTSKKKTNYMMKTILLLSALFVVLIAIFTCIITIFFSLRADNIYASMNSRALTQLADFTDKHIFENVDDLCKTYFNSDSDYQPAQKFFNDMEKMNRDEMTTIQKDLSTMIQHNTFLNDIYLYNSRFDSFISTRDGIVFGASDARNKLNIENRFFTYLDSINSDFYVPQDDNIMFQDQDDLIIYVHYVSFNETEAFRSKWVSCAIMIIKVRDIVEFLEQVEMPGTQSFAIISNDQRALIHSDNFPGIQRLKEDDKIDFKQITTSESGRMRRNFQGKRASYIWDQSRLHDWHYVYILSLSDNYRNILLIICVVAGLALIFILAGLVIIRMYSRKLYKPFNSTIQRAIDKLEDEEQSDNELEVLNYLMDKFDKRKTEFDEISIQYSEMSLNFTALNIVRGLMNVSDSDIIARLSAHGIDFTHKEYGLILIEFNPTLLSTFTVEQSDFILYDVMDALRETFNCVTAASTNNTLEMVVNYDKIDYSKIISGLKGLIPEKSFINVYYCAITDKLYEIAAYHEKAMNMTKYSYVYGFDNTFDVNELINQDADNRTIDNKRIAMLETLLRDGNKEDFYKECNSILTNVKADKYSYRYAQHIVLMILTMLCRVAKESNMNAENESEFAQIINNKSYDKTTMYLFNLADKLFDRISNKSSERKIDLINSIKSYIDKHITEDISLASVAQQFNISAGYLSKFFKESTDQAFSKYIIQKKFAYAADDLIRHPEKAISEIANELGYFDTAYFSRQFKAHYGVTPVQYRKLNQ